MTSFQERFKGKTTVMTKDGLNPVINSVAQPITKDYCTIDIFLQFIFYPIETRQIPYREPVIQKEIAYREPLKQQEITYREPVIQKAKPKVQQYSYDFQPYDPKGNILNNEFTPNPYIIAQPYNKRNTNLNNQEQKNNFSQPAQLPQPPYDFQGSNQNAYTMNYGRQITETPEKQYHQMYSAPQTVFAVNKQNNQNIFHNQQLLPIINNRSHSAHDENVVINRFPNRNERSVDNSNNPQDTIPRVPKTSEKYLFNHSFKNNSSKFKPYTLREYEEMKKTANTRLGGLGPNFFSEDWMKDKEKVQKRQDFAEQVRQFNSVNIVPSMGNNNQQKNQEQNTRKRALDFAKNIPKPRRQEKPTDLVTPRDVDNKDDFDQYEKMHLQYLEKIDQMK